MSDRPNERAVWEAAIAFIAARRGECVQIVAQPDVTERTRQAVEAVAESPTARFVVEHTRIESYPLQIADGKQFSDLLGPLETLLPPLLPPGYWDVIIESNVSSLARSSSADVRDAIVKWILESAPGLKLGPNDEERHHDDPWSVTAKPPGVPFDVTLQRDAPDDKTVLHVARFSPKDVEADRHRRVATALGRKCPKLFEAKHEYNATSVLVLESDDPALANRHVVSEAVIAGLNGRTDAPDMVLLAETDRGLKWLLWLTKDGNTPYPEIDKPGPYSVHNERAR